MPTILQPFASVSDLAEWLGEDIQPASIDWKRADRFISKTDKYRRDYYRYFTGQEWENMRNYDLCINTTALSYEQAAKAIEDFAANMLGWNR